MYGHFGEQVETYKIGMTPVEVHFISKIPCTVVAVPFSLIPSAISFTTIIRHQLGTTHLCGAELSRPGPTLAEQNTIDCQAAIMNFKITADKKFTGQMFINYVSCLFAEYKILSIHLF